MEILSNTRKIMDLVSELKGDLCIVTNALAKIKEDNDNNNNNNVDHNGAARITDKTPDEQPVVATRDGATDHFNSSVTGDDAGQRTESQQQTIDIEEIISAVKDIQSLNHGDL